MTTALSPLQRRLAATGLIAFVALLNAQDMIDPTDGVSGRRTSRNLRHAIVGFFCRTPSSPDSLVSSGFDQARVAVDGDELPTGGFDPPLYQAVRL